MWPTAVLVSKSLQSPIGRIRMALARWGNNYELGYSSPGGETTMSWIHENWTVNCMIVDTQPFDVWHPRCIFSICWNWNPILNDWGPTYCLVTFCRTLIDKSGLKRFHITLMLCLMYHGHTVFISVSLNDLCLYFMMCFTRLQSVSYNIVILSSSSQF